MAKSVINYINAHSGDEVVGEQVYENWSGVGNELARWE